MKKLRITFNSPLVLCFALACTFVTLAGALTGGSSSALLFSTYRASFRDPLMYLRLFTHVLGHSGFIHLMGNMAYILLLGPALEEKYGWRKLLLVICVTAFITGVVHNLLFPQTILLGASSVVFAFILLISFTNFKDGEIPITFILVALIYIGQQVYQGLFVKDNISNMAHIVGGIVGAIFGYTLGRKR